MDFQLSESELNNRISGLSNNNYFNDKLLLATNFAQEISRRFPTVLFIGVTGSVAARFPKQEDDIDFMIITKANTLWLSRLLIKLHTFKRRIPQRKPNKPQNKDELCFNLWLDECGLEMPISKQNKKNATDALLMIPLVNKKKTLEQFVGANTWIRSFWPKINFPTSKKVSTVNFNRYLLANKLAFFVQYLWMKSKIKKEIVNEHQAFFHPYW